ncbi:MAG: helix-turn-helix domain-containing protein [Parvibaculaceae bacterium]|nr:helix-turn-helix domain-containing protein [Parvibaculaceae bacterium]
MKDRVPDLLSRITEVAGADAARLVAETWGGRVLYVPKEFRPTHEMVYLLGEEKARAIFAAIGHGNVEVPMGDAAGPAKRRRIVSERLDQGDSRAEAARAAGVHQRTVYRVAARKKDDRQGDLF